MKRKTSILATAAALGAATMVVAPSAGATVKDPAIGNCIYKTVSSPTYIYENTRWHRQEVIPSAGTYVAGPCRSSDGWTEITRVDIWGQWVVVNNTFSGDRDFMRTSSLRYVSTFKG